MVDIAVVRGDPGERAVAFEQFEEILNSPANPVEMIDLGVADCSSIFKGSHQEGPVLQCE